MFLKLIHLQTIERFVFHVAARERAFSSELGMFFVSMYHHLFFAGEDLVT